MNTTRSTAEVHTAMTVRERFESICNFVNPDRPPRWETLGFWTSTITRWHAEGMPAEIDAGNIRQHFGMDAFPCVPVNSGLTLPPLFPQFEPVVLEETDEYIIGRNGNGMTYRESKHDSEPGTQHLFGFPIRSRADWDDIRWRLDPSTHDYGDLAGIGQEYNANVEPNCLTVCGLYGMPRMLIGEETLSYLYYDDPELIHEIQRQWLAFYAELTRRVLEHVRIDFVLFWEDMAFKNGPLISPTLFAEFMQPYYRDFIAYCKTLGLKNFMVDSDGNNDVLLPLFIDAGVNCFVPFEVAAGNDVREVRRRYPELVIFGGIDKRELFSDVDAIKREVDRVVPWMWERGGYIPCLDHSTPPNVPLKNWEFYLQYLRSMFA
jgi:uroporphyrinogen decarboxylase